MITMLRRVIQPSLNLYPKDYSIARHAATPAEVCQALADALGGTLDPAGLFAERGFNGGRFQIRIGDELVDCCLWQLTCGKCGAGYFDASPENITTNDVSTCPVCGTDNHFN